MTTANINDLKIRVLQLKGLGYDKLLKKEELNSQLIQLDKELDAIAAEVKNIMTTLEQIEQTSSETNASETSKSKDSDEEDGDDDKTKQQTSQSHVVVDEKELGNILSPQSNAGKRGKERKNKTSHTIGRRT